MELLLKRNVFTDKSTVGDLYVDGVHFCYTLEDKDRGLTQTTPLDILNQKKVFGTTAIPTGTYNVVTTMSEHFGRVLPLVENVPGYAGVRIHKGNTDANTEGCVLVGKSKGVNVISESADAFNALFPKIQEALNKGEKVTLTITK